MLTNLISLPTPNINVEPRFHSSNTTSPIPSANTSRKPSLRFKLPEDNHINNTHPLPPISDQQQQIYQSHSSSNSSFMVTPPHTSDNSYINNNTTSPFLDSSTTILEDEVYHQANNSNGSLTTPPPSRKETVMKRNRWGTTRNKEGRPSRARTLRRILRNDSNNSKKSKSKNDNDDNDDENSLHSIDVTHDSVDQDNSSSEEVDPTNRKAETRVVAFNQPLPEEFVDAETGKTINNYARNKIRTTKYTPLSFLPKNIFNQFFHNVANIYFLALIILGAFGIFGVPSPILSAVPLIVIVIITACKDAIEDSRRTVSDLEVNNQITHILVQDGFDTDYKYDNLNNDNEKVSTWRRFKKFNTRLLIKIWGSSKENLTKKGRLEKKRREANESLESLPDGNNRKSFDSDIVDFSPRNSLEHIGTRNTDNNPFAENTESQLRKSFQQQRRERLSQDTQRHHHRDKILKFAKNYWKNVKVGDMVRIYNNDEIPADVVILATSDEDNCCYVETKNLDGETNLKVKQALKYSSVEDPIKKADDLINHQFSIESEGPHVNLYSYQGNLKYDDSNNEEQQESITINNLLLRGCFLRNTKWVIGIVVFTGDDTKIMLNAGITPTKQSRISRELNYYVLLNFVMLFVICFVSGLINGLWYTHHPTSRDYFEFGTVAGTPALNGIVSFFVALILYQSLVPISLYITIEIIKTAQAFFIYSDIGMYYERLDYPCTPKSWSISDDLGQIEYVFSDKTGTLTQNLMEFKKCTINGVSYGKAYTEALAGLRKRQGIDVESEAAIEREIIAKDKVNMVALLNQISPACLNYEDELTFISSNFVNDILGDAGDVQKQSNEHFMLALALCHSVLTEPDPKEPSKLILKAQSPDEAALVGTARSVGYMFKGATKKGLLVEIHGVTKEYQILNALEFNSTRKRMSAIIKIPGEKPQDEPKALLICKGADSIIYGRLSKTDNDPQLLETTSQHLEQYATEGLRTLCIAQRELTWSQYTEWNKRHQAAASSIENREAKMEVVADSIERELILLGGTAIEDRLQDGVPDTISVLAQAGIKLWVLTGDKVETAINIGFSCNLLGNDMELLILKTSLNNEEMENNGLERDVQLSEGKLIDYLLTRYLSTYFNMSGSIEELEAAELDHSPPDEGFGVVIDGDALKLALSDAETKRKFLLLCKQCKAVLCCRVSPAQKAAVVKLVKDTLDVMTLAIGDGSNDVAMIQAADVGVGIAGEEGRQAVMSSDYAIGQFRFLGKLLLVHGRWSYKRFSEMIPSFFFKNVIFNYALFWYGIYNNFDGSYLFEFTYLMFYNLAFTSLPVIFLGVFDQDVSAKVSLLVPQLYRTGILRSEFTQSKFFWYMGDATYQSIISFFFPYLMYYQGFPSSNGLPIDHRYWIGIVVTCIACISCNLYILLHQYRWDWLSSLIIAISILVIYVWTGLWTTTTYSQEFYKAAPQMFGTLSFWVCTFIGVVTCLLPRFVYDFLKRVYWPKDVDIIRECVQRGDFDAYPENYDPTDPNRIKISNYSNEVVKRMSMSPNARVKSGSSFTSEHDTDATMVGNGSGGSPKLTSAPRTPSIPPPPLPVYSNNTTPLQNRKSFIDLFKRKNQGISSTSFYDNDGSLIDDYSNANAQFQSTDSLGNHSVQTEEIAMEDFSNNQRVASQISSEARRISQQYSIHSPRDV
ncbi:phospholipid transporting ATPase [Scheffersomyces coipomensis]|uniref:phospholipid transporting ATPase n=1 Tax=Scheffersomyces coipomensis TaxID=1788519 RepID=UPI00315CEEA4